MKTRWIVAGVVLCVAAGGVAAWSTVGGAERDGPNWGCSPDQVGHSIVESAIEGGYDTRDEAARAWIRDIAKDSPVSADELEKAFDRRTGDDRYEPKPERLYVDGRLQVAFGLRQLRDRTWTMGTLSYCMGRPGV